MSCPGFEVHSDTIRYFPLITVKSDKPLISRRHFIREPSCSFEGDVTTDHWILIIIKSHGSFVSCPVIIRREILYSLSRHDSLFIFAAKFVWKYKKNWKEDSCTLYNTTVALSFGKNVAVKFAIESYQRPSIYSLLIRTLQYKWSELNVLERPNVFTI